MKQGDKQQFTEKDIERYYAGTMSLQERHDIEKAALEDPFLSEAMEGYMQTKTPVKDIAQLNQRLKKRMAPESSRKGLVMIPGWLKIAALILIVVGAGWLVLNSILPVNRSFARANADTISNTTIEKAGTTNIKIAKPKEIGVSPTPGYNNETNKIGETTNTINYKSMKAKVPIQNRSIPPVSKDNTDVLVENKIRDTSVKEIVSAPPSLVAAATPKVYPRNNERPERMEKENIVYNAEKDSLAFSSPSLAQMKVKQEKFHTMKRIVVDSTQTVIPVGNWSQFDEYIATNIKSASELHIQPISGNIVLQFQVNNAGDPVYIKVAKSLCPKCDQEAIRLLKKGPKWKGEEKHGKVNIRF